MVKRKPAKLYLYHIKYAFDCPYCGGFNVEDTSEEGNEKLQVVECRTCGRKRAGRTLFGDWYKFTKKKTERMRLKQKKFKAKFKENKNVKQHSKSVEPERNQRNKTDGKGLEKRRRRIGKRAR